MVPPEQGPRGPVRVGESVRMRATPCARPKSLGSTSPQPPAGRWRAGRGPDPGRGRTIVRGPGVAVQDDARLRVSGSLGRPSGHLARWPRVRAGAGGAQAADLNCSEPRMLCFKLSAPQLPDFHQRLDCLLAFFFSSLF